MWLESKSRLRLAGLLIIASTLALMIIGVLAIRVSEQAGGDSGWARRQLVFAAAALGVFTLFAVVPYPRFGRLVYPFFGFSLLLLVILAVARLKFFSIGLLPERKGAYRWIDMGIFQVQPSEIAKLAQILLLAWCLRLGDHYRKLLGLIPPFLLTLIPMGLILIEPDLGTALLFLPTLYVMLFMAGAKLRHLLGIVAVATVLVLLPLPQSTGGIPADDLEARLATAYWPHPKDENELRALLADPPAVIVSAAPLTRMEAHQLSRIDGWLRQNHPRVKEGRGYQLYYSKMVLGSGMGAGGDWDDAEIYFRLLPDDHTDFIFSIIGGQWGFRGCVIVLLLYTLICLLGIEIAAATSDPFGRLLAVGVIGLLISQVVINVGMTLGLMPITGMTLPLVSYGGSSLVINCAAMGLLINVGQRRPISLARRPFEHAEDTKPAPYRPLERNPAQGVHDSKRKEVRT